MKSTSRLKVLATAASVARAATRPGAPSITERLQSVPRLVRATLDGSYAGTSRGRLALVAAAVAYIVSPVDLLPEAFLPILGAADDAVVISWAIKALIEETDRFLTWELGQGTRRPAARPSGTALRGPAGPGGGSVARELRGQVRESATSYVMESVRKRLER